MTTLAEKTCSPCTGAVPALKGDELKSLQAQLRKWRVVDEHHLERTYTFKDFEQALGFVNRIGAIAEEQQHHPDICLSWGKVDVKLYTHTAGGLTESDFILAAKIEQAHNAG